MSPTLDVLVVGGGPAGSATAGFLAAAGLRVAVAERARFPRDKVCGEFVSAESLWVLEGLGVRRTLEEAGAVAMDRVRVTTPAGRSFEAALPGLVEGAPPALGVSRALLDTTLLERAAGLGAEVLAETEVRGLRPAGGKEPARVSLNERGGRSFERKARVVVAADGRRGTVARLLGIRPPAPRSPRTPMGIQVHLDRVPGREGNAVELHFIDGGYLGLGPVEGGRLDAALLAPRELVRRCGRPEEVLRAFARANPAAAVRLEGARLTGPPHTIGPLGFGPLRPALRGVLFVGDAAGTVDPFAGEGITHALCGASILARLVAGHLEAGSDDLSGVERRWSRAWRRTFAGRTRLCRLLGRLSVRPALLEPAVALLSRRSSLASRLVGATRRGPLATARPEALLPGL